MSADAYHAIRAAKHEKEWGPRAARVYARNNRVFRLFLLAKTLHRNPEF